MSEAKHTQGPWEVHNHVHGDGEFWCSIGANGRGPITEIVGEEGNKAKYFVPVAGMKFLVAPVEEQKANARLIAAAPELLKALKELRRWLPCGDGRNPAQRGAICETLGDVNELAEAIIAKAEGRE